MKYVKKPVVIEAEQWDGTANGANGIIQWILDCGGSASYRCVNVDRCMEYGDSPHVIIIRTLEGPMTASLGDWIIKGVQGEFYPCKPDIFDQTYEAYFGSEVQ